MVSIIQTQVELRHLRYFVALAEHQHFTRAAASAHISQPTLSHQIRQLENAFGAPLVDRVGKRVSLTAAGEALLPHARNVLRQLDEARTAVLETGGLKTGQLNVAAVQTVNATLLPDLLARFSRAYPGIHVSSREVSAAELERGVATGQFDLGIGFSPLGLPGLSADKLFDEELVVIAPKGHPLAKNREVRVRDLAQHSLVLLPRGYCTRELIQNGFSGVSADLRVSLEINSIQGILATIQQTGAATILPKQALSGAVRRDLKAVRLTHPTLKRTVSLIWREGAYRKAAAKAFGELARVSRE
jgi:LysR family transcriptional regulator, cyn operon transcriptional activator